MSQNKMITLISCIVQGEEPGDMANGATYWDEQHETLEEAIDKLKAETLGDYNGPTIFRVVINITRIPLPTASIMPHTVVQASGGDPEVAVITVDATVS